MTSKLKALIVGGEDRNIPDSVRDALDFSHVEQSAKSLSNQACPDAKVIILIAKFSREAIANAAKKLAKSRKIPFVSARTGNYILDELLKHKVLDKLPVKEPEPVSKEEPAKVDSEPVPVVADVAVAAPPTEPALTGLNAEELWKQYGQKSIDTLKSTLKPGEKISEDDLISLFQIEGGVGLPRQDALELLPELSIRGIIMNVKGKTWRLAGHVSMDDGIGIEEDTEEVESVLKEPKVESPAVIPEKKTKGLSHWVPLLAGLPEGPYRSRNQLWVAAQSYNEFMGMTGKPLVTSYARIVIPAAIKNGIVLQEGDQYRVKHDPSIVLSKRSGSKEIKKPVASPEPPKKKEAQKASSESEILSMVNGYFGGSIPTIDRYTMPTRILKKMIPDKYWESLWCQCIARIVNIGHHDNALALKDKFSPMERDRMAYDVLAKLPIEIIVPFLRDDAKDEEKICTECMDKFVFTVGEQKFYQDKFGADARPNRCQKCREARKA